MAVVLLLLTLPLAIGSVSFAKAAGCDVNNFAPDDGSVRAYGPFNGSHYTAVFNFEITPVQAENLKCLADYLEVDFHLFNFGLGTRWEGYRVSSDLTGAMHDAALFDDTPNEQIPAATNISTEALRRNPGRHYVAIDWEAPNASQDRSLSVSWVPSYWADVFKNPAEYGLCAVHWFDPPWCIFGLGLTYFVTDKVFGKHLTFSTDPNTWHPFGGWASGGSSGSPPPPVLYTGYVPDAMIVQTPDGANWYSAAGGRLFWFDKNNTGLRDALLGQRQQRYGAVSNLNMSYEDIHAMEVNHDDAGNFVRGAHMPADNSFMYEYGNPTQYVVKYQHPFPIGGIDELNLLNGANKAVMVPPSIGDLQAYPPQWIRDDLLLFYGDPTVWHYVDRGYRVPGVPTRDCLMVTRSRVVTPMPASAWNYFPTHPTQQAACDFPRGQVLVGQPSGRQAIVLYGGGFAIGSPDEAIAIGAANKAVPVTDVTIDDALGKSPNIPNGHVFRAGLAAATYHYVDSQFHYIPSVGMRDCLVFRGQLSGSAVSGGGNGVEVVPGSFIDKFPGGSDAYCTLEDYRWSFDVGAGNRQYVSLFGTIFQVGVDEVTPLDGVNKARPMSHEGTDYLERLNFTIPNDELLRAPGDPRVYHVVGG